MTSRNTPRRTLAVLAVLVVFATCAAPVVARPDLVAPRFETNVPEPTLTPGRVQGVTIQLRNVALYPEDHARPAQNVRVEVRKNDLPFSVRSGPRLLGTLRNGQVAPVNLTVSVPEDVPAGSYRIPLRVTYEYENAVERTTVRATVRVDDRARFRVVDTASNVVAGGRGTLSVTVRNVGSAAARDASVSVSSADAALTVGGAARASRYVGTVPPNENRTVTYDLAAGDHAGSERYALDVTANYVDRRGTTVTSPPMAIGVVPRPALTFALRNLSSDLRVGREGTLTGTVVNRGPRPARDAVVVLKTPSGSLRPGEGTYPLGDLAPGESAPFRFSVGVDAAADAGPRPFTATVEYVDARGDARTSDPVRFQRRVAPERERFRVDPVNTTVQVDTDNRITVTVTNVGDVPLRDVDARMTAGPPFTSEASESYVGRLRPGASTRMAFQVTVSEDAVANTQAVAVNLTAKTPDGKTVVAGPYMVPVTVTEQSGPGRDCRYSWAGRSSSRSSSVRGGGGSGGEPRPRSELTSSTA
ncbi:MAG: COG1361 S-layer family protein [Salinigranum sp.]